MSQNTDFRKDLAWNSYFVEGVYDSVYEDVKIAAQQFEESNNTEIPESEIENIVDDIVDIGLNSLIDNNS